MIRTLKEASPLPDFSEKEQVDDKGDKLLGVFRSSVQDLPVSFIVLVQPVTLAPFLPWLLRTHVQRFSHQSLASCSVQ